MLDVLDKQHGLEILSAYTFFLFETRATNSSNLESKSFSMGDLFDLL